MAVIGVQAGFLTAGMGEKIVGIVLLGLIAIVFLALLIAIVLLVSNGSTGKNDNRPQD